MDVCVHFHCATLCLWEMRLLRGMRGGEPWGDRERLSCSPREILWQYLQLTAFNRHWHLLSRFDIGTQQIAAEVRASVERNPKSSELGRDWEDFCQQEFLVFCCCCQAVSWLIGNDRSSLSLSRCWGGRTGQTPPDCHPPSDPQQPPLDISYWSHKTHPMYQLELMERETLPVLPRPARWSIISERAAYDRKRLIVNCRYLSQNTISLTPPTDMYLAIYRRRLLATPCCILSLFCPLQGGG